MNFYSDDENDYHIIDHLNFSPEKFKINLISLKGGSKDMNPGAKEYVPSQPIAPLVVQQVDQPVDIEELKRDYEMYQVEFEEFCDAANKLGIGPSNLNIESMLEDDDKFKNFKEILNFDLKIKEDLFNLNFEDEILELLDAGKNPVKKDNVVKLMQIYDLINNLLLKKNNQTINLKIKFLILIYNIIFDNKFEIDQYVTKFVEDSILENFLRNAKLENNTYLGSDFVVTDIMNVDEDYFNVIFKDNSKLNTQNLFTSLLNTKSDGGSDPDDQIVPVVLVGTDRTDGTVGTDGNGSDHNDSAEDGDSNVGYLSEDNDIL